MPSIKEETANPGQACRFVNELLTQGERFRSGQRPRWRRSRVEGSRAGLVLGMKAGLGEQLAPSPFYLCEGGQPGLS
jgi:hypothetical protein